MPETLLSAAWLRAPGFTAAGGWLAGRLGLGHHAARHHPEARTARLIAALLGIVILAGCGVGGPPSDAAMIEHFRKERPAFDAIARMMAADGIVGELVIDPLPSDSPGRRARRDQYRPLVRRAGCRSIIRDPDGRITFERWYPTSGGGVAGTGFKAWVHTKTIPSPIVSRLDGGGLARFQDTFRHVDGPWYLCRTRI